MHPASVNCRFATTVRLILPVKDVSTLIAVTAQAFSAQHFKGCEQEVSGSCHIWKRHTCPVCQAEESPSAGTAPAKHVCPCIPVPSAGLSLAMALQQGNPKSRF